MKRFMVFVGLIMCLCLLPVVAFADQVFVVCDPQTDADGYVYVLDGAAPVSVPYQTIVASDGITYAKIVEVTNISTGPHIFSAKSYRNDPVWGRLESSSVPFSFVRPSVGLPSGAGLKRQ